MRSSDWQAMLTDLPEALGRNRNEKQRWVPFEFDLFETSTKKKYSYTGGCTVKIPPCALQLQLQLST
eukprot:SAG11_NODE_3092_length_2700_cov_1.904652_1_plen_67_part_00